MARLRHGHLSPRAGLGRLKRAPPPRSRLCGGRGTNGDRRVLLPDARGSVTDVGIKPHRGFHIRCMWPVVLSAGAAGRAYFKAGRTGRCARSFGLFPNESAPVLEMWPVTAPPPCPPRRGHAGTSPSLTDLVRNVKNEMGTTCADHLATASLQLCREKERERARLARAVRAPVNLRARDSSV